MINQSNVYMKWTSEDIEGLAGENLQTLWTEIDESGRVVRELGFDNCGVVMHKAPTEKKPFGYFDNQIIEISNLSSAVGQEEFSKYWNQ